MIPNESEQFARRHQIDSTIQFPGERASEFIEAKLVIGFIFLNPNHASIVKQAENIDDEAELEKLSQQIKGNIIPIHAVLRERAAHPTVVEDFTLKLKEDKEAESTPWILVSDRYASLRNMQNIIGDFSDKPIPNFIYDIASSYNPDFLLLSTEEIREKLHEYFAYLKDHLKKGGALAVQLEDGDEITKLEVSAYNRLVSQALGNNGFQTPRVYLYEREDGSQGTLYLFRKDTIALGENDPYTGTAVDLPSVRRDIFTEIEEVLRKIEDPREAPLSI